MREHPYNIESRQFDEFHRQEIEETFKNNPMKPDRNELIEKATTYIKANTQAYKAMLLNEFMADFALSLEEEIETSTVKALRKRGTDKWYWYDAKWYLLIYPESLGNNISIDEIREYYKYAKHPLPEDAELVTLECRIKTIEP